MYVCMYVGACVSYGIVLMKGWKIKESCFLFLFSTCEKEGRNEEGFYIQWKENTDVAPPPPSTIEYSSYGVCMSKDRDTPEK